jgi:hypothetical protein
VKIEANTPNPDGPIDWSEANQIYLGQALAQLKTLLQSRFAESRVDPLTAQVGGANDAAEASVPDMGVQTTVARWASSSPMPALEALCSAFHLSPFERSVLLLCAGVELDSDFARLCAKIQDDPLRTYPTFSLALGVCADAHWSALAPAAPLRRWRLIETGTAPVLTLAPLRIDERVLHYLVGVQQLDERLSEMVELLPPEAEDLVPSHLAIAHQVAAALSSVRRARDGHNIPIIQLCGSDPAECRSIARAAAAMLQLRAAVMPAELVPGSAAELEAFLRLWEREDALGGIALLLLEFDRDSFEGAPGSGDETRAHARNALRLLGRFDGNAIMSVRERRPIAHRAIIGFDVNRPLHEEQSAAWITALGDGLSDKGRGAIDAITSQFNLGLSSILSIAAEASARATAADAQPAALVAWDLCRVHLRTRLDNLAQWIKPTATWDDLVLSETQRTLLRHLTDHVRQRSIVHERWGFAAKGERGLGISSLFAGPSGTGKTMAAEVLANELHLDLYRIDLSQLVSKYIGETEKNLRRVFDAAESSGTILLFDEADALFGKRSEVKDSHDRYANIEVSYLLQRMEAYRGLAILTTNHRSVLDPAFLRRLRFVVQFPFPDAAQRAEIWHRVFPASTPTEGLNFSLLAKLNVAGGNIRNIALNAAFLAAGTSAPVRMRHLLAAARVEYEKLERAIPESEIAGWS